MTITHAGPRNEDVKARARAFIVIMGVVALFGDMTYEGARGLVGPYLALLGASATALGFAAGLGEFLGYGLRLLTGWWADRSRAHWSFVLVGYGLNLVAVPGLALVGFWPTSSHGAWCKPWYAALALILLERIGKAIRSPARSTLVSYAATTAGVGKSFGMSEALDQIGAVSGPLLAAGAMWIARGEAAPLRYQAAFFVLLLPAGVNLTLALRARARFPSPEALEREHLERPRLHLGKVYRIYLAGASLMALGFADWALLAFHAGNAVQISPDMLPLLYAAVMGLDALGALLLGAMFDRYGLFVLAGATLISAWFAPLVFLTPSPLWLLAGAACWAVGMAAQDALFKATLAKLVPKAERGRAYGQFFALFGLAWWLGSTAMGWLYDHARTGLVALSVSAQLGAAAAFVVVASNMRRVERPAS